MASAIIVGSGPHDRWVYDENENMVGQLNHTEIHHLDGRVTKAWVGMNWNTGRFTSEHEHHHGAARELLELRENRG